MSFEQFDLNALRLSQDYAELAGVRKLLTTVPVRKPGPQDFFRVHPDEAWRLQTAVIEVKEDREVYLVSPALREELIGEFVPVALYTAINRQKITFLWPVKLPGPDGRHNRWHQSAMEAAELAMTRWLRLQANMALGAYELFAAAGSLEDPQWPEVGFAELLRIAFRDRFIDSLEHPVVRRLRGEI